MDQNLIDKLWVQTDINDQKNTARLADVPDWQALTRYDPARPLLMPALMFFDDKRPDLFMSFHHQQSNDLQHYHDFFELIYVCLGEPVGVINGQEIPLRQGTICIMNPNAVHYFKKYTEQDDLVLNIVLAKKVFEKSMLRILFNDPVLNAFFIRYRLENESQPSFLLLPQQNQDVDRLIELLLREYLDQQLYSQVIIESLLTLIFSFILRTGTDRSGHRSSTLDEIMNYIYLNYQTVQLEAVAARFNYHPKYLSTIIRRQTGQTFRDLLTSIRLQNAVSHLLYTDSTIEQIVEIIGYKDRSSFYAAFRKAYGTSPGAYRMNNEG